MSGEPALEGLLQSPLDVELVKPQPVSVRYYEGKKYFTDIKKELHADQFVLQHSNGLCVVGIAPSHPLIANGFVVVQVCFATSPNSNTHLCLGGKKVTSVKYRENTAANKPSGKKKLGAVWLNNYSVIADVHCEDGSVHYIYSCIRSHLYQINLRLLEDPTLIVRKPESEGFIAIVAPKKEEKSKALQHLQNQREYDDLVVQRKAEGLKKRDIESVQSSEVSEVNSDVTADMPLAKRPRDET